MKEDISNQKPVLSVVSKEEPTETQNNETPVVQMVFENNIEYPNQNYTSGPLLASYLSYKITKDPLEKW